MSTRGPRYTSYPPATELGAISRVTVQRELATIAAEAAPISLYVHIPFCRSLCAYCGCNVIPTRDKSRGARYVDTLITELAMLADSIGFAHPISEVALGGGSPNFLEVPAIRQLSTAIARYFTPAADTRWSVELDPRTTTTQQLDTFSNLGFRSLSIGVQDFAPRVQDAIRRHQSEVQTRWLVDRARAVGFDDLNIDIVYGLPFQTETTFSETLDAVIALAPDRIALFGYAHLPSRLPHQLLVERAGRVLDRYERATLMLLGIQKLQAAGYVHLGLDHFARPDSALAKAARAHTMTRTFQGYVDRRADTILGVGTSAISSTPRMIWQNSPELHTWETSIEAQELPISRGLVLDRDDQIRRTVITKLMCDGEVDLRAVGDDFAIDAPAYFAGELGRVATLDELARYDATTGRLETTALGRLLVRNVCMVFDRYADEGRGSSTI